MLKRKNSLIDIVFMVSVLFPYISFFSTPFSLQPYSLVFAIIYILKEKAITKKINFYIWLPFLTLIFSMLILFTEVRGEWLTGFRSIYNYLAFSVLAIAFYCYLLGSTVNIVLIIKYCSYAYIITGLIQMYFLPEFMGCCVANIASQEILASSGRGVTSLTPEPTFFGFILCFFIMLGLLFRSAAIWVPSLLSLLFVSRSSLAILCLLFSLAIYFLMAASLRNKFIFFGVAVIGYYILNPLIGSSDLRIFTLLSMYMNDGLAGVLVDESSQGRLYHIVQPFISFVSSFGYPHGYVGLPNGDPRILSGFGSAIYELGIFSLPLLFTIIYILIFGRFIGAREKWLHAPFIVMAWINANQLGMPILILYLILILVPRVSTNRPLKN